MIKRKPYISIIITSNNNIELLAKCLSALDRLKNVEIIIVNNFLSDDASKEIDDFLENLSDDRIIFYQSKIVLTKNHARNLGVNFSSGSWIYFIDDYDCLTKKFVSFLNHYKLDPKMHFYRLQILSKQGKKIHFNFYKSKYFSNKMPTFLINSEVINNFNFRFEDNVSFADSLVFIYRLYNIKNVNFENLKRIYAIYHDFNYHKLNFLDDKTKINTSIDAAFEQLYYEKKYWYKQYILILAYKIYQEIYLKDKKYFYLQKIKSMIKDSKIWFWHSIPLGFVFFLKVAVLNIKLKFVRFDK